MIAWAVNQFRMSVCKHGFEKQEITVREEGAEYPVGKLLLLTCPRCGYVRKVKVQW